MTRLLITGAAGEIGSTLRAGLRGRYTLTRLSDVRALGAAAAGEDQLARCCIDAFAFHFLVLYGVSANTRARWLNPHAAAVGYQPEDNAEDYLPDAHNPAVVFHGGAFCGLEFSGDIARID